MAPGVRLMEAPGHTTQDITTRGETDDGLAALTHRWWYEGAGADPRATDPDLLQHRRERVREIAALIAPGHGPPFRLA